MNNTKTPGVFIALEGIDGSGKSTQIQKLAARLASLNLPCLITQEPTDAPIGRLIRQVLCGQQVLDSRAVAALFVADRLDHLTNPEQGLCAACAAGVNVLCDRYYFSSYAYQSVDLDLDWLIEANRLSAELLRPTLTIFLDVPVERAMARIRAGRDQTELYEKEERLLAVRRQYFAAFDKLQATENIAVVDADADVETVAGRIWQQAAAYFA